MGQDEISLGDIAWFPDHAVCEKSRLNSFLKFCGLHSYDALYGKSVHDVAWFTERLLSFLGIEFDRPYDRVLDLSRGLPWARWCVGAKMNITRSCLDRHLHVPNRDIPAVIWEGEEGKARSQTYAELSESVECCAVGLRSLGLGAGDAIAIHLPMMPETVAALLAVARIGAIAVPLFSGYGPAAIESRLSDVEAKAVITCDAFPRRGRLVPAYPAVDEAARGCPTINRVFVVRRAGEAPHLRPERDISWDCLMELGASSGQAAAQPETMDAEDPLLILYTSGTTGKPKGILHSHCGFPIKAAQDMALGTDVGPADRICWVTDIGWRWDLGSYTARPCSEPPLSFMTALPIIPIMSASGTSSHEPVQAFSASLPLLFDQWPQQGLNRGSKATSLRSEFSLRPAKPGIPGRGSGCLKRSGGNGSPSSITPVARRSREGS